jgi:hypothetical protein
MISLNALNFDASDQMYIYLRRPCQALSTVDKYVSRLSDPVVVTWPGIIAPILQSTPLASGAVRLSWQPSYVTKGITIKQYVVCVSIIRYVYMRSVSPSFLILRYSVPCDNVRIKLCDEVIMTASNRTHIVKARTPFASSDCRFFAFADRRVGCRQQAKSSIYCLEG